MPSIRSSKYGFFRRNIHRQKSLAVSSGMAAPKKAVRNASGKSPRCMDGTEMKNEQKTDRQPHPKPLAIIGMGSRCILSCW